jgi:hypothetical protein
VREHSPRPEAEQGDRNRQECKVVEQNDGKDSGQRQLFLLICTLTSVFGLGILSRDGCARLSADYLCLEVL